MTVCIGAICNWYPNSNAVIIASDRMITNGDIIQHEHDMSKIVIITERIFAMMAGNTLSATTLIQKLVRRCQNSSNSVEEVVNIAKLLYSEVRSEQINEEIFRPRGITMEQFYVGGLQSRFHPHIATSIDDQVMNFDYGVELIIAGTDNDGAHLYTVGNPGTSSNCERMGYVAIGIGALHATQSMIGFGHSAMHSMFER